ncbi:MULTISPECIES: type I-C CRISPR-associated protein Cas7/Csd2 [unclassified Novosphingobium]|uniref:type I-C CRISPR-associated protein Cas7/Csd2 n=1 Tax=unclassified Novosphingobium TaxID=2644732 RepID=UPI0014423093|nr:MULTISPECIES: type I-C CRISPR-associated protein Cas7/Csd2 [unclassified Novosphingobium]MBB3359574.1 CRISPR-associated protein Csd2 [Novosphingobium sp. BK256]MBB3376060.1 CRISPR-associated protein Csd2 [Novosphingobium sp. BK280]MBB3380347.1 CRISPR-associated protein Csd2 [Novosphingobium sp. BK258]MBB3422856.1 CRISPR-associated protein Csd2 [Novosphingobium sp. BK267]MBB3450824.1 CRISPR-associated protein Csd2 [Novosphingobium sp. BK352]
MSTPVTNRYEFVLFFDVTNGNPNGDPDAGNMPRLDPETNQGLVSDVALKRKVRNYVALASGNRIYMTEGSTLNLHHDEAWKAVMPEVTKADEKKKLPKEEAKARALTQWMCANFWDIRTFGAVMSTGVNAGQVRGPVQFSFARSVEPILPLEVSITRMAATTEADAEAKGGRTMGRKHIVPYGLYRAHGYVSAPLASHPSKGTGFSEDDLELLWQALDQMFDHDRSAARGEMATRKLILFRHDSALGNARAQSLFDRVSVERIYQGQPYVIGSEGTGNLPPARHWSDYRVSIDRADLPQGVEIIER